MSKLPANRQNRVEKGKACTKGLCALLLFLCLPVSAAASQLPHIFVITVDTLRRDHVGCYGYEKPTTPNIDALAKNSYFFKNSFANSSWTMPSYMSFFTGLYPGLHQTISYQSALPQHITTLAQILKRTGYATGGIVSNPTLSAKFGFGRGFDFYDDFSVEMGKELNLFDEDDYETTITESITSEQVTDYAIKWLKRNISNGRPLFLFLHYFDPHPTYMCHWPEITFFEKEYHGNVDGKVRNVKKGIPENDLQHILALYDSEIRHTDRLIGVLLDFLKGNDLYEESIVLFFADHGEEFLDHGKNYHGHTLYNELIAVPIVLKLPHQKEQVRVDYRVSLVDLMPTILDFLYFEKDPLLSGQSLLKDRKILETLPGREICFETESGGGDLKGMIKGKRKIIRNNRTGSFEAYDIEKDFEERENIFDPSDPLLAGLQKSINQYCVRIKSQQHTPALPLDKKIKDQLKALGYI